MPGFENSAAYFERRADKAREPAERERFEDVARHYRSLSQIVPGLPKGCKMNGVEPLTSQVRRWKARAEECRVLAEHFDQSRCRRQLLELAETYERLIRMRRNAEVCLSRDGDGRSRRDTGIDLVLD